MSTHTHEHAHLLPGAEPLAGGIPGAVQWATACRCTCQRSTWNRKMGCTDWLDVVMQRVLGRTEAEELQVQGLPEQLSDSRSHDKKQKVNEGYNTTVANLLGTS